MFAKLFKKLTPKALYDNFLKDDTKEEEISISFTGNFPLWEHQIDMLKRCLSIERNIDHKITVYPTNAITYMIGSKPKAFECKVGIMNDPPGVGKTHVMLSLIQEDETPSLNLVICPPNLVHQWKEAIDSYFPQGVFPYICVSEFYHTYINPDYLKNVKLIIVSSMLAERLSVADFKRVIVDEVDSLTGILHNIPKCDRVWFMSASFDPTDEKNRMIGAFNLSHLKTKEIVEFVCRYTDSHNTLETPTTEIIEVDDTDLLILRPFIPPMYITDLHTLNLDHLKCKLVEYHRDTILKEDDFIGFLKLLQKEYSTRIERLRGQPKEETDRIQDYQLLLDKLNEIISKITPNEYPSKLDHIKELCSRMIEDSKWLIFADNYDLLQKIRPILTSHKIQYTTTMEGSPIKNEQAIRDYHNNDSCKAILINSMKDGCGLNLENTTHILFLHYTNPEMVEQVIGRAQRPGRTCRLHIVCLYHKDEIPLNTIE
jgi:hypothetical protein